MNGYEWEERMTGKVSKKMTLAVLRRCKQRIQFITAAQGRRTKEDCRKLDTGEHTERSHVPVVQGLFFL
jgi:hypothetical protein